MWERPTAHERGCFNLLHGLFLKNKSPSISSGHLESGQGVSLPTSNRVLGAGAGCLCRWRVSGEGEGGCVGVDLLPQEAACVSEMNLTVAFSRSKCSKQSVESTVPKVWTRAGISTTATVVGVRSCLVILMSLPFSRSQTQGHCSLLGPPASASVTRIVSFTF